MTSSSREFGRRQTTDQPTGAERRGAPRQDTSLAARIITPGGRSVRCCIVNISNSGALLMAPVSAVPDHFDLHDSTGRSRRVEVVRRETARIAVRFLSS
jgi:PilZ domain